MVILPSGFKRNHSKNYKHFEKNTLQKTLNKISNIQTIIIETKSKDKVFRMPGNSSFPNQKIMFL